MRRLALIALVIGCASRKPPAPLPPLPHAAYAHYLEGKLAVFRSDWGGAADALAKALADAPDQPMIAVELARAQAKAKRQAAARDTLAAAREKWPDHPQIWLVSGDLLGGIEAIHAYRRVIELAPDDERGYLGLAKLERPAQAEAILHQLVERIPGSTDGHYRLAVRLAQRGDLQAAMTHLREVLELDPDHIDARLDLARALRRTGHIEEAISQTRGAFDRAGQPLDIAEELFWLLCEADDQTAAIDLLTLLDDDRSDTEALAAVARLDRGLGRIDEARTIATRVETLDPEEGALALAEIDIALGDGAAGAKRVLDIPPDSTHFAEARRLAAEGLLAAGDPKGALDAIAPARTAFPTDSDVALAAAFASVDAGDVAGARAVLRSVPELVRPLAAARVEDRLGDHAAALLQLELYLAKNPDSATALNLAGYLLADANQRLPQAEKWLRHARELAPGDPAILDSWGWLLLRQGHTREAVRVLDRAARYAPREAEVLVHLAAAWAADGAPRTAESVLDRAALLHPTAAVQRRIDALRAGLATTPPTR